MVALLDEFFERDLFRALGDQKRRRKKRGVPASRRLEQLGFTIGPTFARLVDFIEAHDAAAVGPLYFFEIDDMLASGKNSLEFLLVQPMRVDATMLHAFPLGASGAGDLWLVSLTAKRGRHEVFLFGHDTGAVELAADSLEAFMFAAYLTEREAPATPAERRALIGHVNRSDDLDLDWLEAKSPARSTAPIFRLLERSHDLRSLLNGYSRHEPARVAAKLPANPLPAQVLDALLRAFLRCDDDAFRTLARRFGRSPSKLVRDAIAYLRRLAAKGKPATFEHRKRLLLDPAGRAAKVELEKRRAEEDADEKKEHQASVAAAAAGSKARDLQQGGDQRQAVKYFEKALKLMPDDGELWAAYCYSLYCLERWTEMRDAAKQAVAFDEDSSYAYQQLACACSGLDDTEGTIRAGRQALALDPKNAHAMYVLAAALLTKGDREGRRLLQRAYRLNPELREAAATDDDIQKALAALR